MAKHERLVIIGSGPAGYTAAIRAGQWGLSVALIEKDARLALHVVLLIHDTDVDSSVEHAENAETYD